MDVLVVGPTSRDLVLTTDGLSAPGGAVVAGRRREVLGGKGALPAVAAARAGATPRLLSVVGDDPTARFLVRGLIDEGVDVAHLCRRPRTPTGLIVEVLEPAGPRFVLDVPEGLGLTAADVDGAVGAFGGARAVVVSLVEPAPAVRAAIGRARDAGAMVVLDGSTSERSVLAAADVVRADGGEAARLAGRALPDAAATDAAATQLLDAGPRVVVLEAVGEGNVVAWREGAAPRSVLVPLPAGVDAVDTTGAGDAFVGALAVALAAPGGADPETAVRAATAASAAAVVHPGGRLPSRSGRGA